MLLDVKEDSAASKAGLQSGDVIRKINGRPMYFVSEYDLVLRGQSELEVEFVRNYEIMNTSFELSRKDLVVISSVYPDTPAMNAGIRQGDVIVSVNGQQVSSPEGVVEIAGQSVSDGVVYEIKREGEVVKKTISPDESGMIGVGLSVVKTYENEELSVYSTDFPVSVLKIDDVRYPFWIAPFKAIGESVRLGGLTFEMAGTVFRSVFTQFSVPKGVAGPVGIAQLTHVFVQEGVLSVLRFVALLSLSLAIINIIPFPALDGGRLFFILVEVIIGRRISPKFEALIHAIGFLVLMLLVVVVTYSDILRLF